MKFASDDYHDAISAARKSLDKKTKNIQSECIHDYKYHPDPSGNNDSWYICEGCGLEAKRI
jgi:hypothetical protein